MQRVFRLPEGEERCKPEHYVCTRKFKCLRFRVEPTQGVPLGDHSSLMDICAKFLPLTGDDKAP